MNKPESYPSQASPLATHYGVALGLLEMILEDLEGRDADLPFSVRYASARVPRLRGEVAADRVRETINSEEARLIELARINV